VEVYYERIKKLAHGLQVPIAKSFLINVFWVGLQSHLIIVTARMKRLTFQQHKEQKHNKIQVITKFQIHQGLPCSILKSNTLLSTSLNIFLMIYLKH
jgi:hypothetical protein